MKNIERWVDKGLIDENLAQVLRDDIKEQTQKQNRLYFQIILYTIGVILIAAGVITFVSGNDWIIKLFNKIPLLKEILLLIVTVLSFWGGYNLKFIKQKYFKLADALIYLSNLLIGANYALLGQIYNWNSNALVGYLWLLSIIPFAYIFKSNAINRVCLVLFIFSFYSFYDELNLDKIEAWTVIIPLSLSGILYGIANFPKIRDKFSSFSLDYKMTSVFFAFFTLLVLTFSVNPSYNIAHPCYILPAVLYCLMSLYNYFKGSREDKLLSKETIFFHFLLLFL